jgi:hypothetical protein
MKNKMTVIAAIPALMLAVAGYAQESTATTKPKAKPGAAGAIEVGAISAISKVTSVDPAKRTVTLTNPDGVTNTYKLGKNVRNFDQIKVGDEVKVTLLESMAVTVSRSSAPPDAGARSSWRSHRRVQCRA